MTRSTNRRWIPALEVAGAPEMGDRPPVLAVGPVAGSPEVVEPFADDGQALSTEPA